MSLEERTAPGLHDHLIDVVLPSLQLSGRRILDVGAGAGALAARLASRGFDVTGVEREVERFGAKTPIIRADLDDPSWSDQVPGRFSLVLAVEVIEHVENPIQFRRAVSRLLEFERPRGGDHTEHGRLAVAGEILASSGCGSWIFTAIPPTYHPYSETFSYGGTF